MILHTWYMVKPPVVFWIIEDLGTVKSKRIRWFVLGIGTLRSFDFKIPSWCYLTSTWTSRFLSNFGTRPWSHPSQEINPTCINKIFNWWNIHNFLINWFWVDSMKLIDVTHSTKESCESYPLVGATHFFIADHFVATFCIHASCHASLPLELWSLFMYGVQVHGTCKIAWENHVRSTSRCLAPSHVATHKTFPNPCHVRTCGQSTARYWYNLVSSAKMSMARKYKYL